MSDPFESFKLYNALRLHFTSDSYDAIKYNYKTSVKPQSFFKRRDKYFFAKLARKYPKDMLTYYVANFKNDVTYVGEMLNDQGEKNYLHHLKIAQSIHRTFEVDINTLSDSGRPFDALFECDSTTLPFVIKSWMAGEITLETAVILDQLMGYINRCDQTISETIVWPDVRRKLIKYKPFVRIDKEKCVNILKKRFTH